MRFTSIEMVRGSLRAYGSSSDGVIVGEEKGAQDRALRDPPLWLEGGHELVAPGRSLLDISPPSPPPVFASCSFYVLSQGGKVMSSLWDSGQVQSSTSLPLSTSR